MSYAPTVGVDFGPELSRPPPRGAGMIQVNMGGQKMADMFRLETKFSDPFDHGLKNRFRPAIDEKQLIGATFN